MTYKEKLEKIKALADKMYSRMAYLTNDTRPIRQAMDEYHQFIINEYHKEEPVSEKECMYSKDSYTAEDRKALCDGCEEERCKYSKLNTMLDVALSKETKESWNKRLKEETKESVSEDLDFIATRNALAYVNNINRGESPWLDSDMELAYEDGMKAGAQWKEQQLMAKAIDATVHSDAGGYPCIPQMELYDYEKDIPLAKEGEKVKVLVIKQE